MDLIELDGEVVVAGPDTTAHLSRQEEAAAGIRFRPRALPRLLAVPTADLRDRRVPLQDLRPELSGAPPLAAALRRCWIRRRPRPPHPGAALLREVTARVAAGTSARRGRGRRLLGPQPGSNVARCTAIPGGTAARSAVPPGVDHGACGCADRGRGGTRGPADQPHLHRDVRDLAGVPLESASAARRTDPPTYRPGPRRLSPGADPTARRTASTCRRARRRSAS